MQPKRAAYPAKPKMDNPTSVIDSPETNQPTQVPARQAAPPRKINRLRSLTRLLVGGVELGAESLLNRLAEWEQTDSQTNDATDVTQPDLAAASNPGQPKSTLDLARVITIGVIFDTQERLGRGFNQIGRAGKAVNRIASKFLEPLERVPGIKPIQRNIDQLAARGEQEVSRWIKIGRQEETQSKALAELAIIDTVGKYIEYLAAHPAVEELVEDQSTSLATEVVEEVRERAVSLDTFIEGIARGMLRRTPRSRLPQPPAPVRMSANTLRGRPEIKGKVQ